MSRLISMWSGPRNISTAMMYSWRQRPDTEVVDEPLYGAFLARSGRPHPAAREVMAAMDCDAERVIREVLLRHTDAPVRFFKNMAHHLDGLDPAFLDQLDHVLLCRDPREVLTSLVKQLPEPLLGDTGLPQQVGLLRRLQAQGRTPVVLLAKDVLRDPAGMLRATCAALDLPWEPAMLSWPPGPKPEDGVWAPHWYHAVHRSTGFAPWRPKEEPLPERLEGLYSRCVPLFDELFAARLIPRT